MRKLTLNPDDLNVETFQTGAERSRLGTVRGAMDNTTLPPLTLPEMDTAAEHSCGAVTCQHCVGTSDCGTGFYDTCNTLVDVYSCVLPATCPATCQFTC